MRVLTMSCALLVMTSGAHAEERGDPKVVAVRMITLAEIASEYCPDLRLKPAALERFLLRARVRQGDVLSRYGEVAGAVARQFATLATQDQDAACSQIWALLGDHGLGLVSRQSTMR